MRKYKWLVFLVAVAASCMWSTGSASAQKITSTPPSKVINEGSVATVDIRMTQPIICPGGPPCSVDLIVTSSDPAAASVSPNPISIDYTQWASVFPLTITTTHDGVYTGNKHLTLTLTAVTNAPYYSGYVITVPVDIIEADPVPVPSLLAVRVALKAGASTSINVLSGVTGSPDPASLAITVGPAHGTAVVSGSNIAYTAAVNYSGSDQLTYRVCSIFDATVCASAVLDLTVDPVLASVGVPDTGVAASGDPGGGLLLATLAAGTACLGVGCWVSSHQRARQQFKQLAPYE